MDSFVPTDLEVLRIGSFDILCDYYSIDFRVANSGIRGDVQIVMRDEQRFPVPLELVGKVLPVEVSCGFFCLRGMAEVIRIWHLPKTDKRAARERLELELVADYPGFSEAFGGG